MNNCTNTLMTHFYKRVDAFMKTCDFYQTHTHVHPRHLLSHHFIVSWGFCVPNIEFCTSAETKATRAEV